MRWQGFSRVACQRVVRGQALLKAEHFCLRRLPVAIPACARHCFADLIDDNTCLGRASHPSLAADSCDMFQCSAAIDLLECIDAKHRELFLVWSYILSPQGGVTYQTGSNMQHLWCDSCGWETVASATFAMHRKRFSLLARATVICVRFDRGIRSPNMRVCRQAPPAHCITVGPHCAGGYEDRSDPFRQAGRGLLP